MSNSHYLDTRASHVALYSLRPTIRDASYLGLGHIAIHSHIPPLRAGVSIVYSNESVAGDSSTTYKNLAVSYSVFKMRHKPPALALSSIPYRTEDDVHDLPLENIGLRSLFLERQSTHRLGPRGTFDVRERFLSVRSQQSTKRIAIEKGNDDRFWEDCGNNTPMLKRESKSASLTTLTVEKPHTQSRIRPKQGELFRITRHQQIKTTPPPPSPPPSSSRMVDESEVSETLGATFQWLKNRVEVPKFDQIHLSRHTLRPRAYRTTTVVSCNTPNDDEQSCLAELLDFTPDLGGIVIPSKTVLPQRAHENVSGQAFPLCHLISESFDAFKMNRQPPLLSAPILRRTKTI